MQGYVPAVKVDGLVFATCLAAEDVSFLFFKNQFSFGHSFGSRLIERTVVGASGQAAARAGHLSSTARFTLTRLAPVRRR